MESLVHFGVCDWIRGDSKKWVFRAAPVLLDDGCRKVTAMTLMVVYTCSEVTYHMAPW